MRNTWKAALAALMILPLTAGCSGSQTINYALLTGDNDFSGNKAAAQAWNGMNNFAMAKETAAARYEVNTVEAKDADSEIKKIVKAGASTIVCVGSEMETALYRAQNAYGKVHFVMLGGEPRKDAESESSIGANTICLTYDDGQAGYLAGYAAVYEGYRHPAFLAGTKSDKASRYQSGYVKGIQDAAADLKLGASSVTLDVIYTNLDELSPKTTQRALDLYDEGCDIIMGCGSAVLTAVTTAAEARDKKVISAGQDLRAVSPSVLMGIEYNSAEAAEAALRAGDAEDFVGGTVENYGAAQNSVALAVDFSTLSFFTENVYKTVYAELASGARQVPEGDYAVGSDLVAVNVK